MFLPYLTIFQTPWPTPVFLAPDVTYYNIFDLVELQISQVIQTCIVLWVSEQYLKSY